MRFAVLSLAAIDWWDWLRRRREVLAECVAESVEAGDYDEAARFADRWLLVDAWASALAETSSGRTPEAA